MGRVGEIWRDNCTHCGCWHKWIWPLRRASDTTSRLDFTVPPQQCPGPLPRRKWHPWVAGELSRDVSRRMDAVAKHGRGHSRGMGDHGRKDPHLCDYSPSLCSGGRVSDVIGLPGLLQGPKFHLQCLLLLMKRNPLLSTYVKMWIFANSGYWTHTCMFIFCAGVLLKAINTFRLHFLK